MNLPFYSKKKLIAAFEYGVTIADVAKSMNIPVTPELIKKAEIMILNEFHKSPQKTAIEMIPNIMSIFEPK